MHGSPAYGFGTGLAVNVAPRVGRGGIVAVNARHRHCWRNRGSRDGGLSFCHQRGRRRDQRALQVNRVDGGCSLWITSATGTGDQRDDEYLSEE